MKLKQRYKTLEFGVLAAACILHAPSNTSHRLMLSELEKGSSRTHEQLTIDHKCQFVGYAARQKVLYANNIISP